MGAFQDEIGDGQFFKIVTSLTYFTNARGNLPS